jgi:hypothetical protein
VYGKEEDYYRMAVLLCGSEYICTGVAGNQVEGSE